MGSRDPDPDPLHKQILKYNIRKKLINNNIHTLLDFWWKKTRNFCRSVVSFLQIGCPIFVDYGCLVFRKISQDETTDLQK